MSGALFTATRGEGATGVRRRRLHDADDGKELSITVTSDHLKAIEVDTVLREVVLPDVCTFWCLFCCDL